MLDMRVLYGDDGPLRLFVAGEWEYATDDVLAVRQAAPGREDTLDGGVSRLPGMFAWADAVLPGLPLPPPSGETRRVDCPSCPYDDCDECEGQGDYTCPTCEQVVDCPKCGGARAVARPDRCRSCGGSGYAQVPGDLEIDGCWYDGRALARLRAIPGAEYVPYGSPPDRPRRLRVIGDGNVRAILAPLSHPRTGGGGKGRYE